MRRTKEEAERTRRSIMAAALRTFHAQGIARSTLQQIAEAAGVTRGAIYWHFADKEALFRAIRDDVSLPLVDRSDVTLLNRGGAEPLERVEQFLLDILRAVEEDERTRLAFAVMSYKCEYVGALEAELDEFVRKNEHLSNALTQTYTEAQQRGDLQPHITPHLAALETMMFVTGLLRFWLLAKDGAAVRQDARALIRAHVDGRRKPKG